MKTQTAQGLFPFLLVSLLCASTAAIVGCSSTGTTSGEAGKSSTTTGQVPSKYVADDRRTIEIGKNSSADGGLSFKDPHLNKCWIADGFNFKGYDTLHIPPSTSTAKVHDDEQRLLDWAKQTFPTELAASIGRKGIFEKVVTRESEIKSGGKTLKLETTIVEYSKGGGAARFFAGLYGAGQPILKVQGKMTDGDKLVFTFEGQRSGTSAGARTGGGYMKDEDVQIEDIRSLTLDLTDFIAAIAGKYQVK
ncbi:MAG TPA: DUF4410 domain-containing protein [Candidatus Limnocylindrales bacterium]|nr:DUF4410 domain-containing protein [Candidatus Limnocylindrales bacterium]